MMENKYYTPDITEFHVGFECEFKNSMQSNTWEKEVCDVDTMSIVYSCFEHEAEDDKFEGTFRVKYLDREDIESFGFFDYKKSVCSWYKLEGHFQDSFSSYGYWNKIRLIHCEESNKIKILAYEYSFDEEETVLFAGEAKNKSEFMDILKKVSII